MKWLLILGIVFVTVVERPWQAPRYYYVQPRARLVYVPMRRLVPLNRAINTPPLRAPTHVIPRTTINRTVR